MWDNQFRNHILYLSEKPNFLAQCPCPNGHRTNILYAKTFKKSNCFIDIPNIYFRLSLAYHWKTLHFHNPILRVQALVRMRFNPNFNRTLSKRTSTIKLWMLDQSFKRQNIRYVSQFFPTLKLTHSGTPFNFFTPFQGWTDILK